MTLREVQHFGHRATLEVSVKCSRGFRLRVALAFMLIRLAAAVLKMNFRIVRVDDHDAYS